MAKANDIDLCLVSPCEFAHRKALRMAAAPASPGAPTTVALGPRSRQQTQTMCVSESLPANHCALNSAKDTDDRDPLDDLLTFPVSLRPT